MRKPKGMDPLLGREYYNRFDIYKRVGQEMHFIWFGMKNSSGFFCRRCWTKGFHKRQNIFTWASWEGLCWLELLNIINKINIATRNLNLRKCNRMLYCVRLTKTTLTLTERLGSLISDLSLRRKHRGHLKDLNVCNSTISFWSPFICC